jgi:hypothetical protein
LAFKKLYNAIKRAMVDGTGIALPPEFRGVPADDVDPLTHRMFEVLNIDDMSRVWLNTLVLLDDVGNSELFKRADSYFNQQLKILRDSNCIFYLTIHGIGQLSPSIKQNTAVVYAFSNLPHARRKYVFFNCNVSMEYGEFMRMYETLSRAPDARCMVCDNLGGSAVIE